VRRTHPTEGVGCVLRTIFYLGNEINRRVGKRSASRRAFPFSGSQVELGNQRKARKPGGGGQGLPQAGTPAPRAPAPRIKNMEQPPSAVLLKSRRGRLLHIIKKVLWILVPKLRLGTHFGSKLGFAKRWLILQSGRSLNCPSLAWEIWGVPKCNLGTSHSCSKGTPKTMKM